MASRQRVTASILFDWVSCPTRVYLDTYGDPSRRDVVSSFVHLLWDRGNAYEREVVDALQSPFLDLSHLNLVEREHATVAAMRRFEPLIYRGRISVDDLLGEPDLLRLDDGGYVPCDIKAGSGEEGGGGEEEEGGKPRLHYAVQLALYVDVLERIGLSAGRRAFIHDIYGNSVPYDFTLPMGPRSPETLWDRYQVALAQARLVLAGKERPLGAYSSTCKLCHWYSNCLDDLTRADDLTLVPSLGRSKRDVMLPHVATVAELSKINPDSFADRAKKTATIFRGIGMETLRTFHSRAKLLSSGEARPYLKAPVSLPVMDRELFFDVEVDPMRNICYLHGFVERLDQDSNQERFLAFFADDPTPMAERRAFAEAWAYIKSSQPAATFYYSKYERTTYRNLQARYPEVCSSEEVEAFFDRGLSPTVDLYHDVVVPCTEWPTHDHSIKTLAKYLGFKWRDTNPSGAASIEWYHQWTMNRDPAVRQRILDYNEDDCRATRVLLDGIRTL